MSCQVTHRNQLREVRIVGRCWNQPRDVIRRQRLDLCLANAARIVCSPVRCKNPIESLATNDIAVVKESTVTRFMACLCLRRTTMSRQLCWTAMWEAACCNH